MDLPSSKPEKQKAFDDEQRLEKWLYVHELRSLLDRLWPDDWLTPNAVNNLVIGRGNNDNIGVIDFLSGEISFWNEEGDS